MSVTTSSVRMVMVMCALAGLAACAGATAPVSIPGSDMVVAGAAVKAIETQWSSAQLGRPPAAPCPGEAGPSPAMVTGDFNGDGTPDSAVWITDAGTARLAVAFARLDNEYIVSEVGGADMMPSGALEVGRRGAAYQLASLTVDSYYGIDTIVLRACDGGRTAWFWNGSAFEAQPLAN